MPKRDDFPEKVKQVVSARVGNRCSNPQCRAPTSGPHTEPGKTVNIGVAAHIMAAAAGGPRYDASQSAQDRSSYLNAVWLCQACSKLIDSDVTKFSVALLRAWKTEAEIFAEDQIGKRPSNALSDSNTQHPNAPLHSGSRSLSTNMPPSKRLVANYEAVEFQSDFRSAELAVLEQFCEDPNKRVDFLVITGPAGSGKTRLMLEWCKRLRRRGWSAGFLDAHPDLNISAPEKKCFLVLDYAETRIDEVILLLRNIKASSSAKGVTRIVLLARREGQWLDQVRLEEPWFEDLLAANPVHVISPMSPSSARRFFEACARSFGVEHPGDYRGDSLAITTPLLIQILFFAPEARSESITGLELLRCLMDHERRFWWRKARALGFKTSEKFRRHLEVLGWITAMGQGSVSSSLRRQVTKIALPDFEKRYFKNAEEVMDEVYGQAENSGIKPDLLAEHVVVFFMQSMRPVPAASATAALLKGLANPGVAMVLLGRALSSSRKMAEVCRKTLQEILPEVLAKKGVSNAVADIITTLDDAELVGELDLGTHKNSPALRVAVTGVMFRHSKSRTVISSKETFFRGLEHSDELLLSGERARLVSALQESIEALQSEYEDRTLQFAGGSTKAYSFFSAKDSSLWLPAQSFYPLPGSVSSFQDHEAGKHMADLLIRQAKARGEAYPELSGDVSALLFRAKAYIDSSSLPKAERDELLSDWLHAHALLDIRAGRWGEAQKKIERVHLLRKTMIVDGTISCQSLLNLAICHFQQGRTERALVLLQQSELALGDKDSPRERGKVYYNRALIEESIGTVDSLDRAFFLLKDCIKIRRAICDEMPSEGHLFELALVIRALLGFAGGRPGFEDASALAAEGVSICERLDSLRIDGEYTERLIDALLLFGYYCADSDGTQAACERSVALARKVIASRRELWRLHQALATSMFDSKFRAKLAHSDVVAELLWLAKIAGDKISLDPGRRFSHALIHNDLCAELRFNGDSVGSVRVSRDGVELYEQLDADGVILMFPVLRTERLRMLGNAAASLLETGLRDEGVATLLRLVSLATEALNTARFQDIIARVLDTASTHLVLDQLQESPSWKALEVLLHSDIVPEDGADGDS